MEPYKLRHWRRGSSPDQISFYTCARPGRSKGKTGSVPDSIVDKWVKGLPGSAKITIVSLLGRKPDGLSEFSFYSFSGAFETPEERGKRPLFQDWLAGRHKERDIEIVEYPTIDFKPLESELLVTVSTQIGLILMSGRTVVLVDSGGETRASQVCQHAGLIEDSRS
jgi:hypothetical protein